MINELIVETELLEYTFGPKAQRKRARPGVGGFEELGGLGARKRRRAKYLPPVSVSFKSVV